MPSYQNLIKRIKVLLSQETLIINLLKYSEHKPTTDYLDTLLSHGMIPKITVPTRVTHSSATLIDHIFVNETPDRACPAGTIKSSMTDHYFNFVFSRTQ